MKTARIIAVTMLIAGSGFALHLVQSQQPATGSTDPFRHAAAGVTFLATEAFAASLHETVTVPANEPIPNLPGKRLVSLIVDYPPGASSPPHRHARSAFIYA